MFMFLVVSVLFVIFFSKKGSGVNKRNPDIYDSEEDVPRTKRYSSSKVSSSEVSIRIYKVLVLLVDALIKVSIKLLLMLGVVVKEVLLSLIRLIIDYRKKNHSIQKRRP